jgi:hypothetical protein
MSRFGSHHGNACHWFLVTPPSRLPQFTFAALAILLAVVLIPVGARAAGSLVTLVDSSSTREARVDGTNSLTVATRPASSTTWYQQVSGPGTVTLFTASVGRSKLAISSLTVANFETTYQSSSLSLFLSTDCSTNPLGGLESVAVPPLDTVTVSFPQPLVIAPGGTTWCLGANLSSGRVLLTATGYYYS